MTIEERGMAIAERSSAETQAEKEYYYAGYVLGAKEQEKIDEEENGKALLYAVAKTEQRVKREMIDKACDTFCRIHCPTLCKYGEPCECGGRIHQDCKEYKKFRNAMEE